LIGGVQRGEKPALRAFLRTQRQQLYYMYCKDCIDIIYTGLYNMCEYQVGRVVE
jgi:hypothetical protein